MIKSRSQILVHILSLLMALIICTPLFYAISISMMTSAEIAAPVPQFFPSRLNFDNYVKAFEAVPFPAFLGNSFFVSLAVTLGQLITSSLAAYAFTFFKFPGKKLLFFAVLATVMVPGEVIIVSNYLLVSKMGLLDTKLVLILPFIASGMGIFMVRQYFKTIPKELQEAATLDGCGNFSYLLHIVIPVSTPILASLGIYTFISTWNQYVWPLLTTNAPQNRTVQIGISMLLFSEGSNYEIVLAGAIMIIIPSLVVFFLGQKQLVNGMISGAIKG